MQLHPQTEPILRVTNLSKSFRDIQAVRDLSLEVMKGDIYGFLGPNGSGKSTTIRMLLTLLRPDAGQIEVMSMPLAGNRRAILKKVGSFIEKPDFYENLTAYKNLEILCGYSGIRPDQNRIREILDLVGLKKRAGSAVRTFSKGMKQRLGIAQALLHDPELLILDEPASGLDPSGNRDIRDLIRYLNREKKKTIILSSHNLAEIELIANRMVIINNGQKVVEGEVKELLAHQNYLTSFTLDDAPAAIRLLQEGKFNVKPLAITEYVLQVQCTRQSIPDINAFLAAKGIRIESIKVEQNLEDYFLNLT